MKAFSGAMCFKGESRSNEQSASADDEDGFGSVCVCRTLSCSGLVGGGCDGIGEIWFSLTLLYRRHLVGLGQTSQVG